MRKIATAYGINRAYVYELRERHGLSTSDLSDPDRVFEKLLEGRKCPLRSRLLSPETRESIRHELNLAAIRGPVPSIESKISSIK